MRELLDIATSLAARGLGRLARKLRRLEDRLDDAYAPPDDPKPTYKLTGGNEEEGSYTIIPVDINNN